MEMIFNGVTKKKQLPFYPPTLKQDEILNSFTLFFVCLFRDNFSAMNYDFVLKIFYFTI